MAVYVSGSFKETPRYLLVFDIVIRALLLVWWFEQQLDTQHANHFFRSTVIQTQIGTFLTSYVQLLCLILEACQTSFSNQKTAKPHAAPSSNLPRYREYSIAALSCTVSRSDTFWTHLVIPVSVIQVQFDSIPNQVLAVLAARFGSCFY